ncbi:hypothetical protein BDZ88DRAFT_107483 [Geranomyces variabilis]|nr:hypothetical protein BDZ88DRAFT_107483 [Geranomyces variabilis]KAJ3141833.1 hypothetical protein HDU90_006182 [Geranomyces variabilis]
MQLNAVLLAALVASAVQAHPLKKCKATTTIIVPAETILPIATASSAPNAYPYPTAASAEPTPLPTAVEEPTDSTTAVETPAPTAEPVYAVQATKDEAAAAATAAEAKKAADAAADDAASSAAAAGSQATEAPAAAAGKKPAVAAFMSTEEFKAADGGPAAKKAADAARAKAAAAAAKAKAAAAAKAKAAGDAKTKAAATAAAKAKAAAVAAAKAKAAAQAAAEKAKHNIGAFFGTQSGIGSWFRANNGQDDTSGKSWCGYSYKDYTNGFAPDISQMTGGTNAVYGHPLWETSAKKFCGLEAEVTNPHTGVKMNMYIVDAFDHKWVRSPGSIDVMVKSWEKLTGRRADSKDSVIQGLQWKLTGRRMPKYSFGGSGDQ